MEPGLLAFLGIFALAGICALWSFSHGRSIERRLAARGFEPCDRDAAALAKAWRALTGCDASQELRIVRCRRRAAGRSMLHHFTVRERAPDESRDDTANPGTSYPAYLFDLPGREAVSPSPVTLHVLPPGSKLLRRALVGVIRLGESRFSLEVGAHPWSGSIVAAHSNAGGKLDDLVPAAVQEKIARAASHGFFTIHLGKDKAGFVALPNHRDIDLQIAYLAEWV